MPTRDTGGGLALILHWVMRDQFDYRTSNTRAAGLIPI